MFNTNPFREHRATLDAVEEVLGEKKKLDPVDKDELKGTHADREDGDIDNDGDEDDADKFLHKKRKAISKSMKKNDKKDEVVMNPKIDNDKAAPVEAKESRIRKSLKSVLEGSREEHNKGAIPAQDAKENRKGKGAEEMMKPADDAIANPALDEPDRIKKDAAKMTSNVKVAKGRPQDKKGEGKIIAPGTPMKDPAAMKKESKEIKMKLSSNHTLSNIADAYKSMYEKEEDLGEEAQVSSGPAQHALADDERKDHSDYMKKTHGVKTKYHGEDDLSYHGTKKQVRSALDNHYGKGGDQKEFHPHIYK